VIADGPGHEHRHLDRRDVASSPRLTRSSASGRAARGCGRLPAVPSRSAARCRPVRPLPPLGGSASTGLRDRRRPDHPAVRDLRAFGGRPVAIPDAQPEPDTKVCQNLTLHFAADGTTNVVVDDEGTVVELYCAPVFRAQRYYPKLSISSCDSSSTVQAIVPTGSAGIGWEPVNDVTNPAVDTAGAAVPAANAGRRPRRDRLGHQGGHRQGVLRQLLPLHQVYGTVRSLSPARVPAAIAGLGQTYSSPATISPRFTPGRYDRVAAVSDLMFETSCGCYRYQSQPVPAP
jgi:hypothetical protein